MLLIISKTVIFSKENNHFATMSLSKGVPIETVSKMLGHNKIQTTQIYAKITNKKLEADMLALSAKLGSFSNSMNINP